MRPLRRLASPALAALLLTTSAHAQPRVPTPPSAATAVQRGDRRVVLELLGPAAEAVYRALDRGGVARTRTRTPYGTHTVLHGAAIECEVPGLTPDLRVYRCATRFDAEGRAQRDEGPAPEPTDAATEQLQEASAAVAEVRGGLVLVGVTGAAAQRLRALVPALRDATDAVTRGALACGHREFAADIPRLLRACGFAVTARGAVVPLPAPVR